MQADPRVFERRHSRSEFPINFRCPERGVLVSGLEKIFTQKARPKVSRRACRSLLFILLFRDTARPFNRNQFSIRRDRLTSIPTGSYRKLRAFRRRESESARGLGACAAEFLSPSRSKDNPIARSCRSYRENRKETMTGSLVQFFSRGSRVAF